MQRHLILAGACAAVTVCAASADAQVTIVDDRAGMFIDISATGTALGLSDDGEANITTTVGNALFPAGTVRVGNNGGIGAVDLGDTSNLFAGNQELPSGLPFDGAENVLVPLWDDWDDESGDVYFQEIGDTLIVQWENRDRFGNDDAATATFQLQLFGTVVDGLAAQYLYPDTEVGDVNEGFGASATVGVVSSLGVSQWSFNEAVIDNGTVLSVVVVPEPATASVGLLALGGLLVRRRR